MAWMVNARNRIEKQGDLEAHSFVRAEIIASYLSPGPTIEIPAGLFNSAPTIVGRIDDEAVRRHVRKHGTLRIERRWVENSLPNYELLDAVAIAYGRISELVADAHMQMKLECPVTIDVETGRAYDRSALGGRMPCMIGHGDARATFINLADGTESGVEIVKREYIPEDVAKAAKERYGDLFKEMFGPANASQEEIAASLFRTARTLFLKDGYHVSIALLFREKRIVRVMGLEPEDQAQKFLVMRALAHEVKKLGADAVVALGEAWIATPEELGPYERPAESAKRKEILYASLVTKDGEPVDWWAVIQRGDKVKLGDTGRLKPEALFVFAPIYQVWGKPIPEDWIRVEAEFDRKTRENK